MLCKEDLSNFMLEAKVFSELNRVARRVVEDNEDCCKKTRTQLNESTYSIKVKPNNQRNIDMFYRAIMNERYTDIASDYNVSPGRVRQIIDAEAKLYLFPSVVAALAHNKRFAVRFFGALRKSIKERPTQFNIKLLENMERKLKEI